ncbi:MAG TPA: hypothetical protein VG123_16285 [Streptosporangiaceae bacterium]|nr:hypothetical protein [Streptosporangiaceae bacterium]
MDRQGRDGLAAVGTVTARPVAPGPRPASPPGPVTPAAGLLPVVPISPARPGEPPGGAAGPGPARSRWPRWIRPGAPAARQAALLATYLAAGIAVSWPRATYLAGYLPASRDAAAYVWGFWWMAHQVTHLGNPWATSYLAAPVGTQLGFHTLMPLPGLLMTPVTLLFGPSASYNLLSVACPGLLCYAMYRAARLWLPTGIGAVAAGAFFGLSANLAWRSWYELNLALGALFLPVALAAAVRLSRAPGRRPAIILGLVLGTALLTDQESALLAAVVAALVLLPWLARAPSLAKLRTTADAAVVALLVASPQIIAMAAQAAPGGANIPGFVLAHSYQGSGASLAQLFAPSPRLAAYGLRGLASLYYRGRPEQVVAGYGLTLCLLALLGLVAAWRRRSARRLGLLWLCCSLLALGPVPWLLGRTPVPFPVRYNGVRMSALMPFTWFVRLPGMADFREADRFTELGLLAAALLAGAGVAWLAAHARPVLAVAIACGVIEAGWSGNISSEPSPIGVMPTALPALDGPIAADHSGSIVVDVPFGIRGGLPVAGLGFPPETMVLATADGHPLGDAYVSRIPPATLTGLQQRAFYAGLLRAQGGPAASTYAELRAARRSAQLMHVGWVLVWAQNPAVSRFLRKAGFGYAYQADGVSVYRSEPPAPARSAIPPGPAVASPPG